MAKKPAPAKKTPYAVMEASPEDMKSDKKLAGKRKKSIEDSPADKKEDAMHMARGKKPAKKR